jgi:hypothetical protein
MGDIYRNLNGLQLHGVNLWLVLIPVIHLVFHVTDPVDVTDDFEVAHLSTILFLQNLLQLFVSIVVKIIYHIFVHPHHLGLVPLESFHVDKAIEIINAETYLDSVHGGHLDLILSVAWHRV